MQELYNGTWSLCLLIDDPGGNNVPSISTTFAYPELVGKHRNEIVEYPGEIVGKSSH